MISVIIPTYQHGDKIKKCLDSVFRQTYKDIEVIVVNDGSTDNTKDILKNYRHNVKVVNQENKGRNFARNRGFAESKGGYVIFCDADVNMEKEMLNKMLRVLKENPNKAYAYCSFRWGFKKFALWDFNGEKLKKMNYIHTTSLIRRKCFPGFDENIKRLQDWDLWLTMLEKGAEGVFIPELLFRVAPRKSGISEWLPSIVYKIPWNKFGIRIKKLDSYKQAENTVKTKHNLF